MATVRMAAGLGAIKPRKPANLSALRRKIRAGRKQGRKRGLDNVEMCASDSITAKRKLIYFLFSAMCYCLVSYCIVMSNL